MASDTVRWRNVREFLDDLPKEHCLVKPEHEFCTVCMRINYLIAQDCPLFHLRPKRKRTSATPTPPEARPEPIKHQLSANDVKQALKGEDFPIIEFAGPRGAGGHGKDEAIFEVNPIDVKPVASPPSEAIKRPLKRVEPEEDDEGDAVAEAKPATLPNRDPEAIVQEIMEALEFPERDAMEDEEEPDEEDSGKGAEEPAGPPAVRKLRPKDD